MPRWLSVLFWVFIAVPAVAEPVEVPRAGDFGVYATVSTNSNAVGFAWHVADHLVLMPEVGFYTSNYTVTPPPGQPGANYFANWYHVGMSVYWEVDVYRGLCLDLGPSAYYDSAPTYQTPGSPDTYDLFDWGIEFNVVPKLLLSNEFAIFTVIGIQYYSSDMKDTTIDYDTLNTGFALVTADLGVIYYFR